MTSIADAYVELHVDGDKVEGEVTKAIKGSGKAAEKDSEKSGEKIGEKMAGGFLGSWAKKNKDSDKIGKRLGSKVASGFLTGLASIKTGGSKFGKEIKESFSGLAGLKIPAIAALVPLATSSLSALSGALVAFVGAVAQAGGASLAFVGILGSLVQAKIVAKMAFKDFTKAVGGDEKALAALSPAARNAVGAAKGLTKEWGKVKTAVQQQVFKGLDTTISRLGKVTVPVLRKGFAGTGVVLNGIFKNLGRFVTSTGFVKRFGAVLQGNNTILKNLGRAAVPILSGILALFRALQPAANRLARIIAGGSKSFAGWATAAGRAQGIDNFMKRAFKSARFLLGIFKNLGAILHNVFGAAAPTGDGILKTLNQMTRRLAAFTDLASSKNAIAEWARKGTAVTGTLFKGLGKIGEALLPLFNPDIAGGFLTVFQKMMPSIQAIVAVFQAALMPVIKAAGEAFSDLGPDVSKFAQALSPLLKGVGAVIGQLIKQTFAFVGTVLRLITPVVKIVAGFLGPLLQRFAPIIAFLIFAFTNWSSVIIKMIPIIGKFMAPIVKLSEWLYGKFVPVIGIVGKVVGKSFGFIGKIIGGTMKVIGKVVSVYFKIVWFVIKLYMKAVMGIIKVAWRVIKAVVVPAVKLIGKAVRLYFGIIRKVVTAVINFIRPFIVKGFSVIRAVVTAVMRVVSRVFSSAWGVVKRVTSSTWNFLRDKIGGAMTAIWGIVSNGFGRILSFIRGIPSGISALASNFLDAGRSLGSKVIDGIQAGLSAVGGLLASIGGKLRSAINSALGLPITLGKGPLKFTIDAFAKGTNFAPGGIALVGERGPELVNLPRGSQVKTASETRKTAAQTPPKRMILRIGDRDFVGYIEELADGRIDAADSLAWQGA